MVFISKADALTKKGDVRKGVRVIVDARGHTRYLNETVKANKKETVKKEKVEKEPREKRDTVTLKKEKDKKREDFRKEQNKKIKNNLIEFSD